MSISGFDPNVDEYDALPSEQLEGYRNCTPSPVSHEIDARIAERYPCMRCGRGDQQFSPWTHFVQDGAPGQYDSYRAFVVCPHCGHVVEF